MKFYNRYYKSGYDELITYYPRFYKDVFEMVEILKAQGRILDGLEVNIEQTYLNHFILEADAATIKTWEELLGITYTEELTLDQRKAVVIGRISGYGHIGEPEIRVLISLYTEKGVTIDFSQGIIFIQIEGEIFDEGNLLNTLLRRIPAHLALKMRVHTRRAFRYEIPVGIGGATGAAINAPPVGEDRTSVMPLPLANGSILAANNTGIPPDVYRASTGRAGGAGGIYYHTHTKSKLMG